MDVSFKGQYDSIVLIIVSLTINENLNLRRKKNENKMDNKKICEELHKSACDFPLNTKPP